MSDAWILAEIRRAQGILRTVIESDLQPSRSRRHKRCYFAVLEASEHLEEAEAEAAVAVGKPRRAPARQPRKGSDGREE